MREPVRCDSCEHKMDIFVGNFLIECEIRRKGMTTTSSFYVTEKYDSYGHREYIKTCPHYKLKDGGDKV